MIGIIVMLCIMHYYTCHRLLISVSTFTLHKPPLLVVSTFTLHKPPLVNRPRPCRGVSSWLVGRDSLRSFLSSSISFLSTPDNFCNNQYPPHDAP